METRQTAESPRECAWYPRRSRGHLPVASRLSRGVGLAWGGSSRRNQASRVLLQGRRRRALRRCRPVDSPPMCLRSGRRRRQPAAYAGAPRRSCPCRRMWRRGLRRQRTGGTAGGPFPDAVAPVPLVLLSWPSAGGRPMERTRCRRPRLIASPRLPERAHAPCQMTNPQNGAVHFVGPDGQKFGRSTPAGPTPVRLGGCRALKARSYYHLPWNLRRVVAQRMTIAAPPLALGVGAPTSPASDRGGVSVG